MIFQFPQFALDGACNIPCAIKARGITGAPCLAGLSGQVWGNNSTAGRPDTVSSPDGPSNSSPENQGDGSQIGIVKGVVAVKTIMSELRGWNRLQRYPVCSDYCYF